MSQNTSLLDLSYCCCWNLPCC